jgi:hypothetical protein
VVLGHTVNLGDFMVKVLKSFDSAHSAVNWMTQNRIEDASIEMTGTLKSLGVVKVPSGNYHVVLKAGFLADVKKDPENFNRRVQAVNPITALTAQIDPGSAMGEMVGVRGPESVGMEALFRNVLSRGGQNAFESKDAWERWKADNPEDAATAEQTASDAFNTRARRLINVITGAKRIADAATPKNDTAMQSISREDLVTIITKSVMEVLKSELEETTEPQEGTPEHYEWWLQELAKQSSADLRRLRVDRDDPLVTYIEHYPEAVNEYVKGDERRYYDFYSDY